MVSVTAWKEEINSDDWQELLRKPSHYMQQAFAEHGPSAIFLSTWGTSHQAKGKPIDKSKAESVQLHATIAKEHLPDALRKSGIHGLYIVLKSAEGNPDQDWKIIWLPTPIRVPGARDEALRNLSKVQQPFGIVRNKSAYGIRVRDTHFTEAWEVIHPQQPIPATIADKIIFKVTPLPFGCPPETVKQWLQHIEWNAVLVRPVGPKSWIVAAPDDPPSQFITFNGNPTITESRCQTTSGSGSWTEVTVDVGCVRTFDFGSLGKIHANISSIVIAICRKSFRTSSWISTKTNAKAG